MTQSKSHGWTPYLAPYASFLLLIEVGGRFPDSWAAFVLTVKVFVPLGLFLYFLRRGDYPELKGGMSLTGALADILLGLAVTVLWMAPYVLGWLSPPDLSAAFDPAAIAGEDKRQLALALRLIGFGLATPFIEELFVRSFLIRYLEVFDKATDFRKLPMAVFAWRGFVGTVLYFTFSHVQWEWPVAAATGVIYNLWLYKRGNIGACVLAHATTNVSLFFVVLFASGQEFRGAVLDLFYFL